MNESLRGASPPGSGPAAPAPRRDLSALRMNRDDPPPRPGRRAARVPRWAITIAVLAVAAFLVSRLPLPFLLPKVETTNVQVMTASQASTVLTATGYTVAQKRASVAAKIVGRVLELRVDEGDPVKKGDVIAILDGADLRAEVNRAAAVVEEAKATLADAEREAARQAALFSRELTSESARDAAATSRDVAAAQVNTASASLEAAQANLSNTIVVSPLSGVVIERNVEVGEMVAPGGFTSQQSTGSLVRIADLQSLEVEADINESYIARVKPGQPATIRVDAVPGVDFHGKLRQIVPTADRQRAVVEVKVTIEDGDARLVPDMSSTVTFHEDGTERATLEAKPKILVDPGAVGDAGGSPFVYIVAGGRLARTPIELDGADGEMLVVRTGLSGGETIVKSMSPSLKDGRKVRT